MDSLVGDFSVFASALLLFLVDGLVALSDAGLLVDAGLLLVAGLLVVAAAGEVAGLVFGVPAGVVLAETEDVDDAAGVIVAPTLAEVAGVALAFVEPVTFVLVLVFGAVVVVVPLVLALTPKVAGTVTP